jgi:hypothetical protein
MARAAFTAREKRERVVALVVALLLACGACSSLSTRRPQTYAAACPAAVTRSCVSDYDCSGDQFCCLTVDSPTGCRPGVCTEQLQLLKPLACGRSAECAAYQITDQSMGFGCCCEENTASGTTMQICIPSYTCAAGKIIGIARGCI